MSEIITFRLSEDDENEARALEILRAYQAEGHTTRAIIAQALLKAEGQILIGADDGSALVTDLRAALAEARGLVDALRRGSQPAPLPTAQDDTTLKASFIEGVKAGVKPGIKRKG